MYIFLDVSVVVGFRYVVLNSSVLAVFEAFVLVAKGVAIIGAPSVVRAVL